MNTWYVSGSSGPSLSCQSMEQTIGPRFLGSMGQSNFPPPPAAPIFWVDNLFCHVRTSLKNQHCPLPVLLLIVVKYTYYTTQPFLSLQVLGIKYIGVV